MSTYKIQRTDPYAANGTCLQSYITANYFDLVETLGEPNSDPSADGKVDVEWVLEVYDSWSDEYHVITIYNWKDYDGGFNCRNSSSYKWHIGGKSSMGALAFKEAYEELTSEVA